MDKRVSVGMVAVIIVIVAITAVVLGYKMNSQKQEVAQTPVAAQPSAQTTQPQQTTPVASNSDWKTSLKNTVSAIVNEKTKGVWDKRVEITSVDVSQKAVKGKWWASDAWDWIAWQGDDGKWNVLVSQDGFVCAELSNIPRQYNTFFHDAIYLVTVRGEEKQCR